MKWLRRPRQEQPSADSALLIFGVDPTDPESLDYAGVQLAQAGQLEQAFLASARKHQAVSDLIEAGEHECHWRTAAERGDTEAVYQLGLLAAKRGDKAEARRRYNAAAGAGHALAANALAELFDAQGDEDAALPWYRIAAESGVRPAAFNLAVTLASRGDIAEAERWYRLAAGWGDPLAQCNLGSMLMQRDDLAEAREWFERARDGGDALAAQALVELDRREGR